MNPQEYVESIGKKARAAQLSVQELSSEHRKAVLNAFADALRSNCGGVLAANQEDIAQAKQNGMSKAMLDRLTLSEKRIADMADALVSLAEREDVLGTIIDGWTRPNGLQIIRKRVPVGVVGIIYEARPNVTTDAIGICLKSGNAVILRGGKEAFHTNKCICDLLRRTALLAELNPDAIQLIEDTSREAATAMMEASDYIDLLIPRGGKGLIQSVKKNARVPVIETGAGNCHAYVDRDADLDKAQRIVYNAKVSRPSVCNAIETVLVHESVAKDFLPRMKQSLDAKNVTLYGCERTRAILGEAILPADETAYETEFNDYVLAVKVVDSLDEAIDHINRYSTKHSEAIITENLAAANRFTREVLSAVVYVNASTRFTDGGEFGFGAEIGIATGKLHARGPMGIKELTTVQYVVTGDGQVRE